MTYGISKEAQIRAIDINHEGRKVKFKVIDNKYTKKRFSVSINFPGEHFVRNTLAAIAVPSSTPSPGIPPLGIRYRIKTVVLLSL